MIAAQKGSNAKPQKLLSLLIFHSTGKPQPGSTPQLTGQTTSSSYSTKESSFAEQQKTP
jgi:hypothetical protein